MSTNVNSDNSEIKQRLIQVATRLFASLGYTSTSISMIVSEAGVTKPVLYYYFGSKKGLFDALFREYFSDFIAIMQKAIDMDGSLRKKLTTLTVQQFLYCRSYPDRFRFVFQTVIGPSQGPGKKEFNEFKRLMGEKLGSMFSKAVTTGQILPHNLELLGLSYIGMVHMFMMKHAMDQDFELSEKSAAFLVELFLNGVGSETNRQEQTE